MHKGTIIKMPRIIIFLPEIIWPLFCVKLRLQLWYDNDKNNGITLETVNKVSAPPFLYIPSIVTPFLIYFFQLRECKRPWEVEVRAKLNVFVFG